MPADLLGILGSLCDRGIQSRVSGHSCKSRAATRITPCVLPGIIPQITKSFLSPSAPSHTVGQRPECLQVLGPVLPLSQAWVLPPSPSHHAHTNTHAQFFQDRSLPVGAELTLGTVAVCGIVTLLGLSAPTSVCHLQGSSGLGVLTFLVSPPPPLPHLHLLLTWPSPVRTSVP